MQLPRGDGQVPTTVGGVGGVGGERGQKIFLGNLDSGVKKFH